VVEQDLEMRHGFARIGNLSHHPAQRDVRQRDSKVVFRIAAANVCRGSASHERALQGTKRVKMFVDVPE